MGTGKIVTISNSCYRVIINIYNTHCTCCFEVPCADPASWWASLTCLSASLSCLSAPLKAANSKFGAEFSLLFSMRSSSDEEIVRRTRFRMTFCFSPLFSSSSSVETGGFSSLAFFFLGLGARPLASLTRWVALEKAFWKLFSNIIILDVFYIKISLHTAILICTSSSLTSRPEAFLMMETMKATRQSGRSSLGFVGSLKFHDHLSHFKESWALK